MRKTHFQVAVERLGPNPTVEEVKTAYIGVLIEARLNRTEIARVLGVSLKTAYNWTNAYIGLVRGSVVMPELRDRDFDSLPSSI